MSIQKNFIIIFLFFAFNSYSTTPLTEQFKEYGYIELYDEYNESKTFESLYILFDQLIEFLQKNRTWKQKLYMAKKSFIQSKERNIYSTNFFGFYDESQTKERRQISFYYCIHFDTFISSNYPELKTIKPISDFLKACNKIQQHYPTIFNQAAVACEIKTIFTPYQETPPLLLKVVKYLPSYRATKPHYDGTVFSLFLNSTDNEVLHLCPYKNSFNINNFITPIRKKLHNSILLIPGILLEEFSILPTPHIVTHNNKNRYATIAFAMRPNYTTFCKQQLSPLPEYKNLE